VISRRVPMLIRPAIGDTDPIRYRRPTPDGQFSGNIIDEAMRPACRHCFPNDGGPVLFPASRGLFDHQDANSFSRADGLEPDGRRIF
jgi:hypothetical protein